MSYYDNGFARAQQLYDQQEPPCDYDWESCIDYGLLLGDDTGEVVIAGESCPTCPMRHRCPDGVMTITSKRTDAVADQTEWRF